MWDGFIIFLLLVVGVIGIALAVLPIVSIVIAVKARRALRQAMERIDILELQQRKLLLDYRPIQSRESAPAPEAKPEDNQEDSKPPLSEAEYGEPTDDSAQGPRVEQLQPPAPKHEKRPIAPESIRTLEEKIGLVWFTRAGALMAIVVAGWFFKYMVDNDWIGPWGRVLIGWLAACALLITGAMLARRTQKKVHPVFSQGLMGLGLALVLVATYSSIAFYHLVPVTLAFIIVTVVCMLGGALSVFHRAESILALSLLAAFANPVMLSTGQDKPLALFIYLLVMTTGGMIVAARQRFKIATWMSVLGTVALYAGWYMKFFDTSPPPQAGLYDQAPEILQGAYYPLVSRWPAALFALLFPALWTSMATIWSKADFRKTSGSLILVSSVAVHAAAAALFADHPMIMGACLVVIGLLCGWMFIKADLTAWLGLPMVSAFIALAATAGDLGEAADGRLAPMVIITGGLSAVYFWMVLSTATKQGWFQSAKAMLLFAGAGLGMILLSGGWLMPGYHNAFAAMLIFVSVVYLWLALSLGSVLFTAGAFVVTAIGMGVASLEPTFTGWHQAIFIGIASGWFLTYVSFVSIDLFIKGSQWTKVKLAVLTGAGAAYTALVLMNTTGEQDTLRTVLFLCTGMVYLLLGLRMQRAMSDDAQKAILPFGMAISLFTLAVATLLNGASITMVWALEGAVFAWLDSITRAQRQQKTAHGWAVASMVLFFIAGLRLLIKDIPWVDMQQILFVETLGRKGTLLPVAFFNPQALALAAFGVFAIVAAVRFKLDSSRTSMAAIMLILGHLSLLVLIVLQARLMFTPSPEIPAGLPGEELMAMFDTWRSTVRSQGARMDTVTTVVLGLYSFILLGLGFGFRDRIHRILGLGLFALALAKLGLYDIWELGTGLKMVVGASIATLLLSGAFLYGRFGHRIRTMLAEGEKMLLVLLSATAIMLISSRGHAAQWDKYSTVFPIGPVEAPGEHALEISPELYAQSKSALRDIRIQDPQGREVPLAIRFIRPAEIRTKPVPATLLDPVVLPGGTTRVILDLGKRPKIHNSVFLKIDGKNFMRSTRVESSDDLQTWGLLCENKQVSNITEKDFRLNRTTITYPASQSRYLRITLLADRTKTPLKIKSAMVTNEAQVRSLSSPSRHMELKKSGAPSRGKDGYTIYGLEALPRGIQFRLLQLQVSDDEFERSAQVQASTRGYAWVPIGESTIYRVRLGNDTRSSWIDENLHIGISLDAHPLLRIRIRDGDNPPLHIQKVIGIYRPEEIVFKASTVGEYKLFVGQKNDRGAEYDLASLLNRDPARVPKTTRLARPYPNPLQSATHDKMQPKPLSERFSTWIKVLLGLMAFALLLWTIVIIRKNRNQTH